MTSQTSPSQQEGGRKRLGGSVRLGIEIWVATALTAGPAVILRILDLVHEALCENTIVSKRCASIILEDSSQYQELLNSQCRNIYYKDPELFKTQRTVDRYVDKIAYTFGVSRLALNVVSSLCPERH